MKVLAKFDWDCGRMGELDGLIVTTMEELQAAYGKELDFGECLGKHSEVTGTFAANDITIVSLDEAFIEQFEKIVGKSFSYNPLLAIIDSDEDE